MKRTAIYAGTFDPLTLGHVDLIERATYLFDAVILAVAVDSMKDTLFTIEERMEMSRHVVKGMKHIVVESFEGLLVNYARKKRAKILIRGLRAFSDFEYEFQMVLTNRKLAGEIETVFMMPRESHSYMSSSTVKEVARLGGCVNGFVPEVVAMALSRKFKCE